MSGGAGGGATGGGPGIRVGVAGRSARPAGSEGPGWASALALADGGGSEVEDRRAVTAQLLAIAHGHGRLDESDPVGSAGVFLRLFDGRRGTQEAYANDLAGWFVWLERTGVHPFEATADAVQSFANARLASGRRRAPAPATVARRLACLSHFYRRAVLAGTVDRNPVDHAERPRISEQTGGVAIDSTRARELIAAARARGPRDTLLLLLMLQAGLRVSEAIGVRIEDLGTRRGHRVLKIRSADPEAKPTVIPLNEPVAAAIDAARAGLKSGPLLATRTGQPLTRQHASKLIKRLGEDVGLPTLHPDALRHAFLILALEQNVPLRDVQDAARHADPRTTSRYDPNRGSLDRHPTHQIAAVLED